MSNLYFKIDFLWNEKNFFVVVAYDSIILNNELSSINELYANLNELLAVDLNSLDESKYKFHLNYLMNLVGVLIFNHLCNTFTTLILKDTIRYDSSTKLLIKNPCYDKLQFVDSLYFGAERTDILDDVLLNYNVFSHIPTLPAVSAAHGVLKIEDKYRVKLKNLLYVVDHFTEVSEYLRLVLLIQGEHITLYISKGFVPYIAMQVLGDRISPTYNDFFARITSEVIVSHLVKIFDQDISIHKYMYAKLKKGSYLQFYCTGNDKSLNELVLLNQEDYTKLNFNLQQYFTIYSSDVIISDEFKLELPIYLAKVDLLLDELTDLSNGDILVLSTFNNNNELEYLLSSGVLMVGDHAVKCQFIDNSKVQLL